MSPGKWKETGLPRIRVPSGLNVMLCFRDWRKIAGRTLGDVCGVGERKWGKNFTLFKRVFMERRGEEWRERLLTIFSLSVIKNESIWRCFKIPPMFFLNLIWVAHIIESILIRRINLPYKVRDDPLFSIPFLLTLPLKSPLFSPISQAKFLSLISQKKTKRTR